MILLESSRFSLSVADLGGGGGLGVRGVCGPVFYLALAGGVHFHAYALD